MQPSSIPKGSVFERYASYRVQELRLRPVDITYKIAIWKAPDGSIVKGTLPPCIQGSHFGSELRALLHTLYANGVTQPVMTGFLHASGIRIAKAQVHNILEKEAKEYGRISNEILRAGLQHAPYVHVDDTGARHGAKNGYCTNIGGEHFAYFATTGSKSRNNFLNLLSGGLQDLEINDECILHRLRSGVKDHILHAFEAKKTKRYKTEQGIKRSLTRPGIGDAKVTGICIEAAKIGFVNVRCRKCGQIIVSDRAGQFAVGKNAGCWVHAERPLRKLSATTLEAEAEIKRVRGEIRDVYAQVEEASRTGKGKEEVRKRYDRLIDMEVTSPGVQNVLNVFKCYRDELLKALDLPGLPLHNNASERDIRGTVKFRKVSGGTKSPKGKRLRAGLMTIKQTCYRLDISLWEFMKKWFTGQPIDLADCVRKRYQATCASPC